MKLPFSAAVHIMGKGLEYSVRFYRKQGVNK